MLGGFSDMHTLYGLGSFTSVLKVNTKIWTSLFAWFYGVFWVEWIAHHFQGSAQATYLKRLSLTLNPLRKWRWGIRISNKKIFFCYKSALITTRSYISWRSDHRKGKSRASHFFPMTSYPTAQWHPHNVTGRRENSDTWVAEAGMGRK